MPPISQLLSPSCYLNQGTAARQLREKRKMFVHEMEVQEKEVQRRWPEQRGQRQDSSVAAQRWWKKKRGLRGGGGSPEQLQRERETLSNRRDDWPEAAWPEARRDDGSTTMIREQGGSRDGVARIVAERDGGDAARARKNKRGSRFCALIKLYGLGSIDNRGI
ncbi:hypothetical protein DEO72_LG2g3220 [Vigna unguiculata]|uniref:Uncharacterized protein n=1 Tax=Vigna unguiculata TaxID=3917 RepID=A0A4D6L330_VIGUN|nr:hypothetical protein DEO72_LG2g3220 [Vigna unguiculata]